LNFSNLKKTHAYIIMGKIHHNEKAIKAIFSFRQAISFGKQQLPQIILKIIEVDFKHI